ncbi:hypothetical protein TIFTF001_029472 [Ficus carica]|uniref:Uncharacterized protein n=1 Tax=Ficus carica TaxID=3494 RepID=A0AA88DSK5_FICCA|nr:hypothetical protein TIFTF001_029472 [Ficus carica]
MLHRPVSGIADRLLTYSLNISHELSPTVAVSIPHFTVRRTSPPQYCIRDCWQVAYLQHRRGVVLTWLAVSYFVRLQGEAQRQAISSYVLRNAAPLPGTATGFFLLDEGYR